MTDFNELDLNKPIDELEGEEAKKTLSEFMEKHKKNRTAYDELQGELDDVETEYSEELEAKEELIAEFKEGRAEEAAEHVNMPASLIAERFSFSEIDQIIDEATEFSEEEQEEEDEEEPDSLTTFSDRPEKGRRESTNNSKHRDRARNVLRNKNFPVGE